MHFTWDTTNLCIVVRQWHVHSILELIISLIAVTTICAGYEGLRQAIRRVRTSTHRTGERMSGKSLDALPRGWTGLLTGASLCLQGGAMIGCLHNALSSTPFCTPWKNRMHLR